MRHERRLLGSFRHAHHRGCFRRERSQRGRGSVRGRFSPPWVSAFAGFLVSSTLGVPPTRFELLGIPALEAAPVLQVLALSVLAGWLSLIFCKAIGGVHRLAGRVESPYLRLFLGGCTVAAASLLLGTRDYCGAGMDVIARALSGRA